MRNKSAVVRLAAVAALAGLLVCLSGAAQADKLWSSVEPYDSPPLDYYDGVVTACEIWSITLRDYTASPGKFSFVIDTNFGDYASRLEYPVAVWYQDTYTYWKLSRLLPGDLYIRRFNKSDPSATTAVYGLVLESRDPATDSGAYVFSSAGYGTYAPKTAGELYLWDGSAAAGFATGTYEKYTEEKGDVVQPPMDLARLLPGLIDVTPDPVGNDYLPVDDLTNAYPSIMLGGVKIADATVAWETLGTWDDYESAPLGRWTGQFTLPGFDPATEAIEVWWSMGCGNDAATVSQLMSGEEPPGTASIGNYVWNDLDADGTQDDGDTGINGVTVNLYVDADGDGIAEPNADDGAPVATTVTADDTTGSPGYYLFDDITPASYFLEFIAPADYLFSPRDQGTNDEADSDADATTGVTAVTTLEEDEDDMSWDAGLYQPGEEITVEKTATEVAGNTRTIGFWKNNIRKHIKGRRGTQVDKDDLLNWLRAVAGFYLPDPFAFSGSDRDLLRQAYRVLAYKGRDIAAKAKRQLLACELNLLSGTYALADAATHQALCESAEDALNTPGADIGALHDLLDAVNNLGHHCDSGQLCVGDILLFTITVTANLDAAGPVAVRDYLDSCLLPIHIDNAGAYYAAGNYVEWIVNLPAGGSITSLHLWARITSLPANDNGTCPDGWTAGGCTDLTVSSCKDGCPEQGTLLNCACYSTTVQPPPEPPCGPCEGKVTSLTLLYNGNGSAWVKVVQKKDKAVVFEEVVDAGEAFTFCGTDKDGTLGTDILIFVDGTFYTKIHTSCSQPIGPGLVAGDFEVVAGTSLRGGALPPLDSAAPASDDDPPSGSDDGNNGKRRGHHPKKPKRPHR